MQRPFVYSFLISLELCVHPVRGEAGFENINDTLEYIARCKQLQQHDLTIPSQRRYASYFKNILDGVRPSQPPLLLKRIILSEAPRVSICCNDAIRAFSYDL